MIRSSELAHQPTESVTDRHQPSQQAQPQERLPPTPRGPFDTNHRAKVHKHTARRIDLAVAAVMAHARACELGTTPEPMIYLL